MKKTIVLLNLCLGASLALAAGSATLNVECGDNVQIQATPKTGYHFVKWQEDNNTDNPRTINSVNGNLSYTAVFAINTYDVDPSDIGDGVEIEGYGDTPIPYGTVITLRATPTDDCLEFVQWSDGVNDNPRQFEFKGSIPFTAEYQVKTFTVTVQTSPAGEGDVEVVPVNP